MRKKFVGLAIIAISLFTFNGMAQTTSAPSTGVNTEIKKSRECDRTDNCFNKAFEGLNLTTDQKEKLQQLNTKIKADRKAKATERKESKHRNDSLCKAERCEAKKSYLEEVKAILGPEKYVMFLENSYINGNDRPKAKKLHRGKNLKAKGDRHARDGKPVMKKRFNERNTNVLSSKQTPAESASEK